MPRGQMVDKAVRRRAQRLWAKGAAQKMIAELCGVCQATVKDWRYRYRWPRRFGNHIANRRKPVAPRPTLFTCPRCTFRASDPQGHPLCREVA